MKKAWATILSILMIILLTWEAKAIVGVSPGLYEVDFQPGLIEQYGFSYSFDEGVEAEVYAEGDLAEYVKLSTDKLVGSGAVIAKLALPNEITTPGNHKIYIGARQVTGSEGTVGIVGNVRGTILVKVPYPGKYAAVDYFYTTNANQGEPVNLTLSVRNLGKESINVDSFVEIYDDKNKSMEVVHLGSASLEPTNYKVFLKSLDTLNYKPGDYRAVAVVKYDAGEITRQSIFRLGTLYIGISNYTREFQRDKLNQFNIEIESFWNDRIDNVYADVQIIGHNMQFLTPSITLESWQKNQLSGFFDTTEITENKFQANITINYEGRKTNEIVDLRFKREIDYALYALVGGGIFLGILIISLIIAMIILFIRVKKNEKPSTKEQGVTGKNVRKINKQR